MPDGTIDPNASANHAELTAQQIRAGHFIIRDAGEIKVTSKDSIVWEYRHEVTTKPIPVPAPDDPVPALAIIPADPALVPLPGTPPATA